MSPRNGGFVPEQSAQRSRIVQKVEPASLSAGSIEPKLTIEKFRRREMSKKSRPKKKLLPEEQEEKINQLPYHRDKLKRDKKGRPNTVKLRTTAYMPISTTYFRAGLGPETTQLYSQPPPPTLPTPYVTQFLFPLNNGSSISSRTSKIVHPYILRPFFA